MVFLYYRVSLVRLTSEIKGFITMKKTTMIMRSLYATMSKFFFIGIMIIAGVCSFSGFLAGMSQGEQGGQVVPYNPQPFVLHQGVSSSDLVKVVEAFKSAGKKKADDVLFLARKNAKFIMDVGTFAACVVIVYGAYQGIVIIGDVKVGIGDFLSALKNSHPVAFTQWILGLYSNPSAIFKVTKNAKLVCDNTDFYQALVEQFGSEQAVLELFKKFPKYFVKHGCKIVKTKSWWIF